MYKSRAIFWTDFEAVKGRLIHGYLFYIEKFITQFKTSEKKMIGHYILFFEKMTIYLFGEVQP